MISTRAGRPAFTAPLILAFGATILLSGCRSAPTVDLEPDPLHVIEVSDASSAKPAPLEIGADEDVVWLNASHGEIMKVEVLGFFDDECDLVDCFETRDNRATTREILAPGDAACLRFPVPGVYRYSVNGPDEPVRGQIIVRDEG